jgi:hypothetical protein
MIFNILKKSEKCQSRREAVTESCGSPRSILEIAGLPDYFGTRFFYSVPNLPDRRVVGKAQLTRVSQKK